MVRFVLVGDNGVVGCHFCDAQFVSPLGEVYSDAVGGVLPTHECNVNIADNTLRHARLQNAAGVWRRIVHPGEK